MAMLFGLVSLDTPNSVLEVGGVVVVVGLRDFHPHGYGLERGLDSDPSTPLLTTAQLWGRKRARVFACGTAVVFDSWTVDGVGVAPVNVCALGVLAPSAVAFSQSAVPLDWCPVSLRVCGLC